MAKVESAPATDVVELTSVESARVDSKLVSSLFETVSTFVEGSFIGVGAAIFVGYAIGSPWMIAVSALLVIVSAWRGIVFYRYRQDPRRDENSVFWERWYGLSAWSFSILFGATTVAALLGTDDTAVHLFVTASTSGYVSTIAARNAARPRVVAFQVALVLIPVGTALCLVGNPIYQAMGFIAVIHIFALIRTSRRIRDRYVSSQKGEIVSERLADRLRKRNEAFDAALANMDRGFAIVDADLRLVETNARLFGLLRIERSVGCVRDLVEAARRSGTIPTPDFARIAEALDRPAEEGFDIVVQSSEDMVLRIVREGSFDGSSILTVDDVTAEWNSRRDTMRRATTDSLTRIPNRAHTYELIEASISTLLATRCRGALLYLDLDGFKQVNDLYGHSAGDDLLVEVSRILRSNVREVDIVGRIGGDEFLVFLPGVSDDADVQAAADRLIDAVSIHHAIGDKVVFVGVTIGIALLGEYAKSLAELDRNADMALYSRKKGTKKGSACFFDSQMKTEFELRKRMEDALRETVSRGCDQLSVYYQPIVDTTSREVVGCEALVRWRCPGLPNTSPDKFIPIAEESSMIVDLGAWVLREACREAASWTTPLRVSVNLSPIQFVIGDIVATVRDILDETGLDPRRLDLEFTETAMAQEKGRVVRAVDELKAMGIGIALDDFGQGYSSLSYIQDFSFDKIKIDRQFVMDVETSRHSVAIVRAVVSLAKDLDLAIVAEGIETESHLAFIRDMGVTCGQGYLFSRPLPADDFRRRFAMRPVQGRPLLMASA